MAVIKKGAKLKTIAFEYLNERTTARLTTDEIYAILYLYNIDKKDRRVKYRLSLAMQDIIKNVPFLKGRNQTQTIRNLTFRRLVDKCKGLTLHLDLFEAPERIREIEEKGSETDLRNPELKLFKKDILEMANAYYDMLVKIADNNPKHALALEKEIRKNIFPSLEKAGRRLRLSTDTLGIIKTAL